MRVGEMGELYKCRVGEMGIISVGKMGVGETGISSLLASIDTSSHRY